MDALGKKTGEPIAGAEEGNSGGSWVGEKDQRGFTQILADLKFNSSFESVFICVNLRLRFRNVRSFECPFHFIVLWRREDS